MKNVDVQGFINEVYNKWFCKWRDNLPDDDHSKRWKQFADEGAKLIEKYSVYEDGRFEACQIIVQAFASILYDRKGKW